MRRVALLLYGVCGVGAGLSLLQEVAPDQMGGLIVVLFCVVTWKRFPALFLAVCAAAQTDRYTAAVYEAITADNLTSVSLAIVVDGRTRHLIARGMANRWAGVRATPQAVYPFGAITQTFTAATVTAMADANSLGLDDPVEKHLGGIRIQTPHGGPRVTVRHILAHTSGLVDAREPLQMHRGEIPAQPLLMAFFNTLFATTPAGSATRYSSTGYGALGLLLAGVSGQSVQDCFRERWLQPLGMSSTGFSLNGTMQERLAMGYSRPADGSPVPLNLYYHSPSSPLLAADGLAGTAEDLAAWLRLHLNRGETQQGQLVPPEIIDEMLRNQFPAFRGRRSNPQSLVENDDAGWGLGWLVWPCQQDQCIAQVGHAPGYTAVIAGNRSTRAGVVLLTNSDAAEKPLMMLALRLLRTASADSLRANGN